MRLDFLIDYLRGSILQERVLVRRVTRYILPLLLLPIGFAIAQMTRGWVGLCVGGISALVLLVQIELLLRPSLARGRMSARDARYYLGLGPLEHAPSLVPVMPLMIPSVVALVASMALFLPSVLADALPWQRMLALMLGLGVLWSLWQRLVALVALLDSLDVRLAAARPSTPLADLPLNGPRLPPDGLLDPALAQRVAGLPLPSLPLSPAARALLRIEAYLLLRERPGCSDRELLDALQSWGQAAHANELRHRLLPPVGGKLYLPVAAGGALARLLGATARRLEMDGGYSATLGTWLVRLPPARSYDVAGRLLDALVALRLPPPDAVLPHHLTIQGDLGEEAKMLSLLHLAATPLVLEERPGHARGDDRPFIMRGGGVLDDLEGRGRSRGTRTDFVDGFVFVGARQFNAVEHLMAHAINLRLKQVLAWGLLAAMRPSDQRSLVEQQAAAVYMRFRLDLGRLLERYALEGALEVSWLDGMWSDVWPFIARMNELKQHVPAFLDEAQALRDAVLDELEQVAVKATGR